MRTLNSWSAMLAALVLLLGAGMVGGCTFTPPYPPEMHTFDEGLIGDWGAENPKLESEPIFRVQKRGSDPDPGTRLEPQHPGYIVSWRNPDDREQVVFKQRFTSELLKVGEVTLITVQPIVENEKDLAAFMWSAPMHRVMKISRDGDRVLLSGMTRDIVWMPIQPIDPPSTEVVIPTEADVRNGPLVVSDAKRFIETVKAVAERSDMWSEPVTLVRR